MKRLGVHQLPKKLPFNQFVPVSVDDKVYYLLFPDKPLLFSTPWLTLVPAQLETELVKVYEVLCDGKQQAWAFQATTTRVRVGKSFLLCYSAALDGAPLKSMLDNNQEMQLRYAMPDWHYLSIEGDMVMLTLPPKQSLVERLET